MKKNTDTDSQQKNVPAEASSIELVRELLFGEQIAQVTQQHKDFANKAQNEIEQLNKTLSQKLHELTQLFDSQISDLKKENQQDHNQLNDQIDELNHNLQALDTRLSNVQEELHDQIQSESARFTKELDELHNDVFSKLNELFTKLDNQKTDRKKLAALFSEMASSLEADN